MLQRCRRSLLAGVILTLSVVPAMDGTKPVFAQIAAREPLSARSFPLATKNPKAGQYTGAASCGASSCHGSVKPRDLYTVKQNEYVLWLKQDRHTQAYNVLLNEKSRQIAKNLKLSAKAHESQVCLDCHALNASKSLQAISLDIAEGVACESCHGPAGGWLAQHTATGWTHEQSVKAGMVDLRKLDNRTKQCLSCHLGSEGKTVNHELIAAGHPDLIFELDNYSAVLPPHWIPRSTKGKQDGREENGVRSWAVGQVAAFREGMRQLERRARSNHWPEFAEMNCYACHHSLRDSEWRQERGYRFQAGGPPWNPARYAVMRQLVSIYAPEERKRLDGQVERLAAAIAQLGTPPAQVAATASDLAKTMERIIPRIESGEATTATAKQMIDRIAGDVPYLIQSEVHSVEQAIMSISALVSALARQDTSLAEGAIAQTVDRLYDDVKDRENFNRTQFSQHVAELQQQIR